MHNIWIVPNGPFVKPQFVRSLAVAANWGGTAIKVLTSTVVKPSSSDRSAWVSRTGPSGCCQPCSKSRTTRRCKSSQRCSRVSGWVAIQAMSSGKSSGQAMVTAIWALASSPGKGFGPRLGAGKDDPTIRQIVAAWIELLHQLLNVCHQERQHAF